MLLEFFSLCKYLSNICQPWNLNSIIIRAAGCAIHSYPLCDIFTRFVAIIVTRGMMYVCWNRISTSGFPFGMRYNRMRPLVCHTHQMERVEFEAGRILAAQKEENILFTGIKWNHIITANRTRAARCGCGSQRGCRTQRAALLRRGGWGNPFTRFLWTP